jgi:CO dehydrogenase/acetyl-CoA synthase alpha subunit
MSKHSKPKRECPDSPTGLHDFQPDEDLAKRHGLIQAPVVCAWCGIARSERKLTMTSRLAMELRMKVETARALLIETNQQFHDERLRHIVGHLQNIGDQLERGLRDVVRQTITVTFPDDQEG